MQQPWKKMQFASFWHGFSLPFELVAKMLRDPELRRPFLKLFFVRAAIVAGIFVFPATSGEFSKEQKSHDAHFVISRDEDDGKPENGKPVDVDLPGLHVHLDEARDAGAVQLLGRDVPVDFTKKPRPPEPEPELVALPKVEPDSTYGRVLTRAESGWRWVAAAVAFLSIMEGVVVFFSRRWDDWISHHGARLAGILPEETETKPRKVVLELGWIWRKTKRKIRGYFQFAVGLPLLLPLRLIPGVGDVLFGILAGAWGWYWLGVFTAGKSAHAWCDDPAAPLPVRVFTVHVPQRRITAPVRWYGRTMHWVTRDTHAAACTFERSPAAFLGLGLARALLAAPGLYFLARPVVPLAAGRLCAESDPEGTLWAR